MTEKENKVDKTEKLLDTVTEQPESVRVGDRIFDLQPRTLKQLRAIAKHITLFRDHLFDAVKNAESATTEKFSEAVSKVGDMPFDILIVVVQMFYDKHKAFNEKKSTMSKKMLEEELDYSQIKTLLTKAIELHDIGDLLKKVEGLRAI